MAFEKELGLFLLLSKEVLKIRRMKNKVTAFEKELELFLLLSKEAIA